MTVDEQLARVRAELERAEGEEQPQRHVVDRLLEVLAADAIELDRTLRAEVELQELRADWEERGRLTAQLDGQLRKAQKELARLVGEHEERGRWAQGLEGELRRTQAEYQRLDGEFEQRSQELHAVLTSADDLRAQASALQGDLTMMRVEGVLLRKERDDLGAEIAKIKEALADHASRLDSAELERSELRQRVEDLERGLAEARANQGGRGGGRPGIARMVVRNLFQIVGRATLPFAAAGAAVPLAAAVGAGAALADAIAAFLPRRPRLPSLSPRDPTLATLAILNYNGKDLLTKNLPSCQAAIARTGKPHELLVIDNGSTDGSVELLRTRFPDVKVVALPRNLFFSRGYDAGLPAASHDILVLLNNDMRVEPDFLEPLLEPFKDDERLFAVASQVLMAKGKLREETGLTRGSFHAGRFEMRHDPIPDDLGTGTIPILWAGGGAAAFDKRRFFELGGLDVLYDPFYWEDVDLSLRAWRRGWRVLFAARSKVWHDHRTTSQRVFGEDFVNKTFRQNKLLLKWANVTDGDLLAQHLVQLPRIAFEQASKHGLSGVRSLVGAAARAPWAISRRLHEREPGPSVRAILEMTEAGVSPIEERPAKSRAARDPLRIVMVAPYHLYPVQHGGAVRMYNVVRELARRGHDVSLVGFVDDEEQREVGTRHLAEFCSEVHLQLRTAKARPSPWDTVPDTVREFDDAGFRRQLRSVLERRDIDVLQVEYTHMAPYGIQSDRWITCLTEIDVAFMSIYRHALSRRGLAAAADYARYLKMFRWELEALRTFDVVFTLNARDARLLRRFLGDGVQITDRAPVPIDTAALASVPRMPEGESLLFVGNFDHTPNVDAVHQLAREILPEIWKHAPDVRIKIVGRNAPEPIRRLATEDRRIEVTGFVEDLRPLYASTSGFISPIRVVAGVRVKLLEAFAAGAPVVSTTAGAEGLDVAHEREILLADTPALFAEQALRLLRDRELAARMGAAGRQFVERHYSTSAIADALEDEYRTALRRRHLERSTP